MVSQALGNLMLLQLINQRPVATNSVTTKVSMQKSECVCVCVCERERERERERDREGEFLTP